MTIVKHRLPPREVFDRYMPIVRNNLMKGYHRRLTEKHRWFVRSLDDYFYCDGDRPDLPAVEIFDCDWTPSEWDSRPYRHFYNPVQLAWYTSYAREGLPPLSEYSYGYTRENSLILRNGKPFSIRFTINGRMAVNWHPMNEGRPLSVMYDGIYSRAYNDEISQGIFSHWDPVKRTESSELIPVIREITKKKYQDIYKDLANEIIERFNVPRNEI